LKPLFIKQRYFRNEIGGAVIPIFQSLWLPNGFKPRVQDVFQGLECLPVACDKMKKEFSVGLVTGAVAPGAKGSDDEFADFRIVIKETSVFEIRGKPRSS
jgi:hypothetical protein